MVVGEWNVWISDFEGGAGSGGKVQGVAMEACGRGWKVTRS